MEDGLTNTMLTQKTDNLPCEVPRLCFLVNGYALMQDGFSLIIHNFLLIGFVCFRGFQHCTTINITPGYPLLLRHNIFAPSVSGYPLLFRSLSAINPLLNRICPAV
jgi:hypothetical protein